MFWLKTRKKHIVEFEQNLAQELKMELPHFSKAILLSKVYTISFIEKPKGIFISRGYKPKEYELIMKHHRNKFNLSGISLFNKKKSLYEELKLNFVHNTLSKIEIEQPEYFNRNFEFSNFRKGKIEIEELEFDNPDLEIVKKALKGLNSTQLEKLDLESTFEIEMEEKRFYTILDMEDGNHIATNMKGQIYRLNHDHNVKVKLIAKNPKEFFTKYNGDKSELEEIINE